MNPVQGRLKQLLEAAASAEAPVYTRAVSELGAGSIRAVEHQKGR